ncbi:DUF3616 domain-containing protein [Enterovirga rhinocerotis]|uniref:Uncharacterized protein DUF3616 n=1 Tax=Enterovirga rhinocerotis TaxID=1339210 RepID=A0A4R7BQY1_9HYPH|nr:DUF3616 domain-containing protein [Enterovirga rhinocerotis]TDR88084.1 uncharacterized protein DUF3616 [Enterovirga rhinocerotis]
MRSSCAGALLLASLALGTQAQAEVTRIGDWAVAPSFAKSEKARTSLSGAACATPTNCLVVNDETQYAQFFTLKGRTLVPGRVIRLLPAEVDGQEMKDIDAEGVAVVRGRDGASSHYYVAGSHGASRRGKVRASTFFLFRIPVDGRTGEPRFSFDDRVVAAEITRSAALRAAIRAHPDLAAHAEKSPEAGGVTVEGVAVDGENLLLGLRSPAPGGDAFVVSLPVTSAFDDNAPAIAVRRVGLEKGAGIRDLAAVEGGVLVLSGQIASRPAADEPPVTPAIWFWDGRSERARKLGTLPGIGPADKAEALIVLEDSGTTLRTLVLFDSVENGGPVEFRVER